MEVIDYRQANGDESTEENESAHNFTPFASGEFNSSAVQIENLLIRNHNSVIRRLLLRHYEALIWANGVALHIEPL
jgi:hypothetical protein